MAFDDVLDDGQPQPGAPGGTAAPRIGAIKPPRQMGQMIRGNSRAMVGNRQQRIAALLRSDTYLDRLLDIIAFRIAIFQRIIDQIAQQLFQLLGVAGYLDRLVGCGELTLGPLSP